MRALLLNNLVDHSGSGSAHVLRLNSKLQITVDQLLRGLLYHIGKLWGRSSIEIQR